MCSAGQKCPTLNNSQAGRSSGEFSVSAICVLYFRINCTNSCLSIDVFSTTAIDMFLLCGTYMLFDLIWFVIIFLHIIGWRLSVSVNDVLCYVMLCYVIWYYCTYKRMMSSMKQVVGGRPPRYAPPVQACKWWHDIRHVRIRKGHHYCMSMLACQYNQRKRPGDLDGQTDIRQTSDKSSA